MGRRRDGASWPRTDGRTRRNQEATRFYPLPGVDGGSKWDWGKMRATSDILATWNNYDGYPSVGIGGLSRHGDDLSPSEAVDG
jgi:hypothetical protein